MASQGGACLQLATRNTHISTSPWIGCLFIVGLPLSIKFACILGGARHCLTYPFLEVAEKFPHPESHSKISLPVFNLISHERLHYRAFLFAYPKYERRFPSYKTFQVDTLPGFLIQTN